EKFSITPQEASRIIHNAGGKVVLAHPVCYKYEDGIDEANIKKLIVDMNADGIEANYLYVDSNNRLINEIDKWNQIAEKLNVFTTIGSDFHAYDKHHPTIGFTNIKININEEQLSKIFQGLKI
ncbi:MAG: hypothetical protein IJ295_01875, partial [Clostridia bacterium]|nr:hypothetical protein [Clostridia bacterium]